jgi:DNA anti-recombination protein RmuC
MRLVSFVLVLLLALPSVAFAQQYERFRLPEGRRCTVATETYQCFNLGEYTELLHMDEDLRHATEVHVTDLERIAELTAATTEFQAALTAAESQIETLTEVRTQLTQAWEEESRLRHEAENRPEWDWIPWTLAGGLAVSTIILALIVGIQ